MEENLKPPGSPIRHAQQQLKALRYKLGPRKSKQELVSFLRELLQDAAYGQVHVPPIEEVSSDHGKGQETQTNQEENCMGSNFITPEPREFEKPPRGSYDNAEIIGVENIGPSSLNPEVDRLYFTVRFEDRDSNGHQYELRHYINLASGRKANLTQMLVGILGRDPGGGYDVRNLIGKRCSVTVTHTPPNAEGKVYAKILDFFQPESVHPDPAQKAVDAVRARQQQDATAGTEITEGDIPPF